MAVTSVVPIKLLATNIVRYVRYITLKRLRNTLRCRSSYLLSRMGICRIAHMPTFVSIEPINYCQLRCPECPVGMASGTQHKPSQMDWATFCTAIDSIASYAYAVIFHFQGEPLLHPHLSKMVAYAHGKHLFTMLSTNGQAMTTQMAQALAQAGLDRIIVSVDGLSPQTYNAYRVGGSLPKALAALRLSREAGIPEVVLQCLKLRTNEHEWPILKQRYRELGATHLDLKTAQFYDYEYGHPLMPTHARDARYIKGSDNLYHLKKPVRNHCIRLWSGCVITTSGEVLPCCFDKEHLHAFGNINRQPFADIWHSPAAEAFRRQVLRDRSAFPICTNCTE